MNPIFGSYMQFMIPLYFAILHMKDSSIFTMTVEYQMFKQLYFSGYYSPWSDKSFHRTIKWPHFDLL